MCICYIISDNLEKPQYKDYLNKQKVVEQYQQAAESVVASGAEKSVKDKDGNFVKVRGSTAEYFVQQGASVANSNLYKFDPAFNPSITHTPQQLQNAKSITSKLNVMQDPIGFNNFIGAKSESFDKKLGIGLHGF